MKDYTVSVLPKGDEIQFDSLPVAKMAHYPLEKDAYKPYAQGIFCIGETEIGVRLDSFEVTPKPESTVGAIVYLFPENLDIFLNISATPEGVGVSVGGEPLSTAVIRSHNGEDLQGRYWGYDLFIPLDALSKYGRVATLKDEKIGGNFFKTQSVEPVHYGAFGPTKFIEKNVLHKEKMATLRLVSY